MHLLLSSQHRNPNVSHSVFNCLDYFFFVAAAVAACEAVAPALILATLAAEAAAVVVLLRLTGRVALDCPVAVVRRLVDVKAAGFSTPGMERFQELCKAN